MWIGSVSHDNKIRFWHAGYLFEEDDDDDEEEGEGEEATGGNSGTAKAAGGGENEVHVAASEDGVLGSTVRVG